MKIEIPNHLLVKVSGLVSRGIKAAEVNEDGILIFTLTDGTKIELGSVKGDPGPRGESGVYVGTGEMPEGCNVQIDPSGEAFEFIQPPKTASIGQALLVKSIDETGKPTEWETGEVTGGTGGTSDHQKLSNRDAADQHPIAAITGLEAALEGKQPAGNYLTNAALDGAVDDALAQAKASGEFDGADGKTAYQYAQDGGYTGTEEEFSGKMAAEIPSIDNTLTKSGQAADAAKVGEELRSLSEEIDTTSESKVSAHNTGADTHSDIRLLIQGLTDRLNAMADSDDTTLDQLSEIVAYIKSNRDLIAAITTDKVSVADIIDNLTTNVTNKPLSAAQGVALKALIDAISIPDKLPNPNALTFTGAVTGSYDGSEALTVEIPIGGGGSGGAVSWKLIRTINIVSGTSIYSFDKDNNGNAFKVKNFLILIDAYPAEGYLEIKPNGNLSFKQTPTGKPNYPFSFMMKRLTDTRYILENSTTYRLTFERTISGEYSSFGEFTSFSFWFAATPTSDTTMYILGEDV